MIGGNVLQPRRGIRVLTRRCDVPGAAEVVYGLYECTPEKAARMVTIGAASAADFHFFAARTSLGDSLRENTRKRNCDTYIDPYVNPLYRKQ